MLGPDWSNYVNCQLYQSFSLSINLSPGKSARRRHPASLLPSPYPVFGHSRLVWTTSLPLASVSLPPSPWNVPFPVNLLASHCTGHSQSLRPLAWSPNGAPGRRPVTFLVCTRFTLASMLPGLLFLVVSLSPWPLACFLLHRLHVTRSPNPRGFWSLETKTPI